MANRICVSMMDEMDEPVWFEKVEGFVQTVMGKFGFDGQEISVMFCDNECIQQLNQDYRNIDAPTDVLSFESDGEYTDETGTWKLAGDIAISIPMIKENADYFGTTQNDELKRLLVHGVLHLNGYDHGEEHIEQGKAPECEMLVKQEELLAQLKEKVIIG
ncbi:MAG: rRNA maturation RNase YbeY [Treponema sp.]|nr:rRNA maturation RNase YbeY [Treponema sp.]